MDPREQFTFYRSFWEAVRMIRKKTARAEAYDAICAYALDKEEPDFDSMDDAAAIAVRMAMPILDTGRRKANSGKKGGSVKQTPSTEEANGKQTPSKNKDKDKKKNKNKIKNKCYSAREELDAAFAIFWAEYPKKVGKDAARKAFEKVEVQVEILVDALRRQKGSAQWTKDGGQYIPNPSTWLNQGRWEDELPADTKAAPKGASGQLGQAELEAIQRVLREGST